MSEPTVSAGYARALIAFAASRGADAAELAARAQIDPEHLLDQDNRIPFDRYVALMRAAKALCNDPSFPLEFGAAGDFRTFTVVGLISHAAATMGEALMQLNRYGRLVIEVEGLGDGPRFQNVVTNGELWLEDLRPNPNDFPELTESTWSRFICHARRHFGHATFALAAHVTHSAPTHRADYERIWQVPVTFESNRNALQISPTWPSLEVAPESNYVFGVLTDHADALLGELEQSKSTRGRVESLVMPILHTGDMSMDAIAAKLGLGRRTLLRKLTAEGTTFEKVLDDLRHKLALQYLAGEKVSVNETAYLVGFSDPASFSRAFKRWTGLSPRAARSAKVWPTE